MKRWIVAALILSLTLLAPASDALSRGKRHGGRHYGGRHHGSKYHYGFGFNFVIPLTPLFYGSYYSHPGYYEPYPSPHYYPHRYYPISLNLQDRDMFSSKTQYALENVSSGMKIKWLNPNTAVGGYVIAHPAFKNSRGQWCREYERFIALGRWTERSEGTACRQPDGIWR